MRRLVVALMALVVPSALIVVPAGRSAATAPGLDGVLAAFRSGSLVLIDPRDGALSHPNVDGNYVAWSPSGDRLAISESGRLSTVNLDGTGRLILGDVGAEEIAWAPDGRHIAYSYDSGAGLAIVDRSTKEVTTLDAGAGWFFLSEWSPDGAWLLGSRSEEGVDLDLWKIRPDGSDLMQILDRPGNQDAPTWSPDGSTIAFRDRQVGSDSEIATMPASGGEVNVITRSPGDEDSPSWSPSGRRIAFALQPKTGGSRLFTIAKNGNDLREIPGSRFLSSPTWQPAQVTLTTSRPIANAGTSFRLSVKVAGGNTPVTIQRRTTGSWRNWRKVEVSSSGTASTSTTIKEHTRFRAIWQGDEVSPGGTSSPVLVKARAVVTGRLLRWYARSGKWHLYHHGKRIWYEGKVVPNRSGKRLCFRVQTFKDKRWRTVTSFCFRISDKGTSLMYLYNVPFGVSDRIRAEYAGDTRLLGSVAKWNYYRVTK